MARRKSVNKVGRANGMGTIIKLAGNRRKPFAVRITVGSKLDMENRKTKQDRFYLGYYETYEDADRALKQYAMDPSIKKDEITLSQLYNEWFPIHKRKVSEKTMDSYKYAWNHLSMIGDHVFSDLRTGNFQMVIDKMYSQGKGYDSINKVKILSGLLYKYAIQNDIVSKNYSQFVSMPKQGSTEKEIFTDLEIATIEKHADTIPYLDTILILIYTGLRVSELLELTPFNVHLNEGYIVAGGKTKAGTNRTIPIHHRIYKTLEKRTKNGKDYLITSINGFNLDSHNYRNRYYYRALEAAGIKKRSPHICRHTFATMLSNKGADTKSIQAIMGHTNYALTANVYTHKNVDELKRAVNLL